MLKNKLLLLLKIHRHMFKNRRKGRAIVNVGLVLGLFFILICSSSPPVFYGLFYGPSSSSSSSIFFPHGFTSYASEQEIATTSEDNQTENQDTTTNTQQAVPEADTTTELTEDATVENQPPIANAGPDQTAVQPGSTVTLDGTGSSDPNGDDTIDSYSWSLVSFPPAAGASAEINVQPNNNIQASKATFTAPQIPGDYTFRLVVTDDKGATSAADEVVIRVEPLQGLTPPAAEAQANQPPTADAGLDQTVLPGATVTLDGRQSKDPDGTITSYSWSLVMNPGSYSGGIDVQPNNNNQASKATFTAPQTPGDYAFQLVVTDDKGASSSNSDRVGITVLPPPSGAGGGAQENESPIANAGPAQTVLPGATVTLDGSKSYDPGGTITSYHWSLGTSPPGSGGGGRINPQPNNNNQASKATFTAPQTPGEYSFALTVLDDKGAQGRDGVVITVGDPSNQRPIANAGPDQLAVQPDSTVTLDAGKSYDPDPGGTITDYSWILIRLPPGPSSISLLPSNAVSEPTFTVPQIAGGPYVFSLVVKDDKGVSSAADYVVIRVVPHPSGAGGGAQANQQPIANAGPNKNVRPGDPVILDGTQSKDPDGRIASYSWSLVDNPGSYSGGIGFVPQGPSPTTTFTAPQSLGDYTFQLVVTDDKGAMSVSRYGRYAETIIRVENASDPNRGPIANAGPDQTAVRPGSTVTLDGTQSKDPDGTIVSYSWFISNTYGGASSWINNRGAPTPTLTVPQLPLGGYFAAEYPFKLIVTDDKGVSSAADTVVITVGDPSNYSPIADAGLDQPAVLPGSTVTLDGSKSLDPDGGTITYSWSLLSSPVGGSAEISLQPNENDPTPRFTAPQIPGDYRFQLIVTDDKGASVPARVDITVVSANQRPIANAGPDQTAVRPGSTVTLDGTGSRDPDPGGRITNYYWYLAECPDECANPIRVQPNSTVASPTFTAPQTPGAYTFELVVVDDAGDYSDTDFVVIRVEPLASGASGGTTGQAGSSGGGTGGAGGGGGGGLGPGSGVGTTQGGQQGGAAAGSFSQCVGADLADNANQPQSQIEFTQYENATHGIRIMYPANWTISEFDTKPVVVFSAATTTTTTAASLAQQQQNTLSRSPAIVILNVNSSSNSLPVQNMTQDQFSIDYVTRLIDSTTHYDLLLRNVSGFSNTTSPISGTNQQGAEGGGGSNRNSFTFNTVEYSGTSFLDGCDIRGIDLWTVINGKLYSITYLAVEPLYFTYLPLVQQMINSFQVTADSSNNSTR
jgi:hypothetical protein